MAYHTVISLSKRTSNGTLHLLKSNLLTTQTIVLSVVFCKNKTVSRHPPMLVNFFQIET